MSQHTPGPWSVRHEKWPVPYWFITNDDGPNLAAHRIAHVTEEADARLIAAAPDLLAALQAVMPFAESGVGMRWTGEEWEKNEEHAHTVTVARAAIASALGQGVSA